MLLTCLSIAAMRLIEPPLTMIDSFQVVVEALEGLKFEGRFQNEPILRIRDQPPQLQWFDR